MYIDGSRSWFQHGGAHHNRQMGGIHTGSVIGVLLDLDAHTLRFTVDGQMQVSVQYFCFISSFVPDWIEFMIFTFVLGWNRFYRSLWSILSCRVFESWRSCHTLSCFGSAQ